MAIRKGSAKKAVARGTAKSKGSIAASTKAFNSFLKKEKSAGRTVSAAARSRVLRELQASERRRANKGK